MEILLTLLLIPIKFFFKALIKSMFNAIVEGLYQTYGYEVITVLGNTALGLILGCISLVVIPQHITPNIQIRFVNLLITPFIFGALLNLSSNIKFQKKLLMFDLVNFVSGFTLALTWAAVRFFFAK